MGAGKRRVDISFDREREALRTLADVLGRVTGRAVAVGTSGGASEHRESTELERFARELQARSETSADTSGDAERPPRAHAKRGEDRRSRHVASRGHVARSVVLPPSIGDRDERRKLSSPGRRVEDVAPERTPPLDVARTEPPSEPPRIAPHADDVRAARYLGALVAAYGPLDPLDEADAAWPLVDLLVLDASALAALARGNARARAHLSHAVGSLARIVVPVTALVDATHARVARAIGDIEPVDAAAARFAARGILATGIVAPTTALAVAAATRAERAAILTGDVDATTAFVRFAERSELYVFAI
ncbi:MAG: hypothetical protein NVS3B17_05700 [Vulcanimicrobiaceae bacterium]